jgi:uncharacterized protein YwgA
MSIDNKQVLKNVIDQMINKGVPAKKIVLHKLIFYLRESGIPITYRFEPYIYGPYSKELKNDLDDLVFWNELKLDEKNNLYSKDNFQSKEIGGWLKPIINKLDDFAFISDNNYEFDNMEIVGTLMYCIRSFDKIRISRSWTKTLDEFKAWKGNKYTPEQIKPIYDRAISKLLVA